jgi:hypothetical protein
MITKFLPDETVSMRLHMRDFISILFVSSLIFAQPIALHTDNPHYFIYKGNPVILLTSAEHYGAVLNLEFTYIRYLNSLQQAGMNYTRIFTGSYFEPQGAFGIGNNTLAPDSLRVILPWARSDQSGYSGGGNKFNLAQWNEDYFTRLTDFIAQAEKRDIMVEVTLFSSIYTGQNWAVNPLNPDNNINHTTIEQWKNVHTTNTSTIWPLQEALIRKIVRELNGFDNIFYEIQNEPWSDQTVPSLIFNPYDRTAAETWYKRADLASEQSLAWQQKVAVVIKEEESQLKKRHLIAQNYCNFKYPLKQVAEEISIINFHYAYPEVVRWNYGWDRVIGYDETGFAGNADVTYRQQAWRFILSGGGLFNNLDYSFVTGHEDGTFVNRAPGGGSTGLRKQLAVLQHFMQQLDFTAMRPDYDCVRKAPGVITYALSQTGKQYAIYLDGDGPCTLSLALPKGTYEALWLNPATGSTEKTETITVDAPLHLLPTPDFKQDLALRLECIK